MKTIEYPIKVNKINYSESFSLYEMGGFAKVRPCGEEYENKTYLGLFLGELPTNPYVTYNTKDEELNVGMMCNPAIYVFDHLGYTEHDEKKIDELANALYMIIQDNPEIFKNYGGK